MSSCLNAPSTACGQGPTSKRDWLKTRNTRRKVGLESLDGFLLLAHCPLFPRDSKVHRMGCSQHDQGTHEDGFREAQHPAGGFDRVIVGDIERDYKTGVRVNAQKRCLSWARSSPLEGPGITSPWIFFIRPRKSGLKRGTKRKGVKPRIFQTDPLPPPHGIFIH